MDVYNRDGEVFERLYSKTLDAKAMSVLPNHIRAYLTLNLAITILMAIVMAVRAELRTGRFLLIDFLLFAFYALVLSSLFFGPFGVIEAYLYRRKKGAWYEWKNRTRHHRLYRAMDLAERRYWKGEAYRLHRAMDLAERRYWKSEAYRLRLSQGGQPQEDDRNRTRLFQNRNAAHGVSRASLLMTVADKFERSGKREAAERCYLQITQRFTDSPQAEEAARRLDAATKV